MARSRSRRKGRSFTRRKSRADWVFRNDGLAFNVDGNAVFTQDELGTYSPDAAVVTSPSAIGLILYDSRNYLGTLNFGGPAGLVGAMSLAGRASARKARTHMVRGSVLVDTSSWAVNDELILGLRIGVFEQSPVNGSPQVDANYSMFDNLGGASMAQFANQQRSNLWERRVVRAFSDSNQGGVFQIPIFARTPARLNDEECLALYVELDTGSVNMRFTSWLSTLVTDEG